MPDVALKIATYPAVRRSLEKKIADNKYMLLYKLDYYNEIIFTVLLQKLAYEISIAKGLNPDKPRNLAKVVTVE